MTVRVSKWKRKKNPDRLILQPRDRKIMTALYYFRILTREQIQTLFGLTCTRRANSRLRKLYDYHYLSRKFLPTTKGSPKAIYYLGPKGVMVTAQELGIDLKEIKKKVKETSQLKELFLNHSLQIIEARIAFSRSVQNHPTMRIERWFMEHELQQKYTVITGGKKKTRRFRPDGYFRVQYQGNLHGFFLELDRSTMSRERFEKKIQTYLEFERLGYYESRFGMKKFELLVITLTSARLSHLKKVVEKVVTSVMERSFWFTTLDQITQNIPLAPVWWRAGYEETYSLFKPFQK